MRKIDVCLSPELFHLHDARGKIVVIVDVLRATTCMVTAFQVGVKSVIPVATVEECSDYQQKQGWIAAGERNGEKIPEFDMGNSPYDYLNQNLTDKTVVITTTNGTKAINQAKEAAQIVIGAFLNVTAVANYLLQQNQDVIILCSGWKGKVNLEDTLFAGALIEQIQTHFMPESDVPLMTVTLFQAMKHDLVGFIKKASHGERLKKLSHADDTAYCCKIDTTQIVPILKGKELVVNK